MRDIMKLLEKVIAGILIGIITYLYFITIIHEGGHYFYAIMSGWKVLNVHISIPALIETSVVSVAVPTGESITFFLMAGSWNCLIWGFIISLFPIFLKNHHIFLSIGYALMSDSLIYPILDNIYFKSGDWYYVGFIPSIITISFFCIFLILSIGLNKIIKGFKFRLK